MYADPKHIKKHPYKVNFDDQERALLEGAANAAGEQPSAYIRELCMEMLRDRLALENEDRRRA